MDPLSDSNSTISSLFDAILEEADEDVLIEFINTKNIDINGEVTRKVKIDDEEQEIEVYNYIVYFISCLLVYWLEQ